MVGNYFVISVRENGTMYQRVCRDEQMQNCDDSGIRFPYTGSCLIDYPSVNLTFDATIFTAPDGSRCSDGSSNNGSRFGVTGTLIAVGSGAFIILVMLLCAIIYIRRQKRKFGNNNFTRTAEFDGEEVHLTSEDEDLMILYLESVKENKRRQY